MRRYANGRLIVSIILFIGGASISSVYGKVRTGGLDHKLIALSGVLIFVIFAVAALNIFSHEVLKVFLGHRILKARAAAIQFVLRCIGYIAIILAILELLGISVERLLLGGAVLGIILGVAAQQALANFFASVVLVISHPFTVGDKISLISGSLGGKYTGTVIYLGLTHTRLKDEDGNTVYLPNTALLSGAAIMKRKIPHETAATETKETQPV